MQQPPVEQIAPGVTLEWLCEGRVGLIRPAAAPDRAIQEVYYNYLCTMTANWDENKPLLFIFDARHTNLYLTPYDRQRTMELHNINNQRKLRSRSAVILKRSVFTQVIAAFLNLLSKQSSRRAQHRIFHDVDSGLRWLKEELGE